MYPAENQTFTELTTGHQGTTGRVQGCVMWSGISLAGAQNSHSLSEKPGSRRDLRMESALF